MRSTFLLLLFSGLIFAQPAPVTQTALFPSPGSQTNPATGGLLATGTIRAPLEVASPLLTFLQPGSPSTTGCYVVQGSIPYGAPGTIVLNGTLQGVPNSPFVLVISVGPGALFCGGFAGWPCMTGPYLMANQPTPYGLLHLGGIITPLFDGFAGTAPPGFLDGSGSFSVSGTLPVETTTGGGVERHYAVQAAIVDPTHPQGVRLTAAVTLAEWVFYL